MSINNSWKYISESNYTFVVNVLVIGSGGREHSLSWKLSQSDLVDQVYVAPGNGGTSQNIAISVDDLDELANFAQEKNCGSNLRLIEYLKNNLTSKSGDVYFTIGKAIAVFESFIPVHTFVPNDSKYCHNAKKF